MTSGRRRHECQRKNNNNNALPKLDLIGPRGRRRGGTEGVAAWLPSVRLEPSNKNDFSWVSRRRGPALGPAGGGQSKRRVAPTPAGEHGGEEVEESRRIKYLDK